MQNYVDSNWSEEAYHKMNAVGWTDVTAWWQEHVLFTDSGIKANIVYSLVGVICSMFPEHSDYADVIKVLCRLVVPNDKSEVRRPGGRTGQRTALGLARLEAAYQDVVGQYQQAVAAAAASMRGPASDAPR